MFKQNRLIQFAQQDDSIIKRESAVKPVEEQQKLDSEKQSLEAETELKQKIYELRKKNQDSNNDKATKELAEKLLDTKDSTAIELVESLLAGSSSQGEFIAKANDYFDKLNKVKIKSLPSIADRVSKQVSKTAKLKNATPEEKSLNKKFSANIAKLDKLNTLDKQAKTEILTILAPEVQAGRITQADAERFADLDPVSSQYQKYYSAILGPELVKDKKLVAKLNAKKAKQKELAEQFDQILNTATEILEKQVSSFMTEKQKYQEKKRVQRITGIYPEEGKSLEFLTIDENLKKVLRTTEIQKVEFLPPNSDIAAEVDAGEISPDDANLNAISNSPEIRITVTDYVDGKPVISQLSKRQFIEWVNQQQVTEVVSSYIDLEDKIDFSDYNQILKEGMEIEYVSTLDYSTQQQKFETVKILSIDESKNTIKLDKPILVMNREYRETQDRMKDEVTFAEFAKWFNKTKASQKMDIAELKGILKEMPLVLKTRYPNIDPRIWEFNDLPIQVVEGEELVYGDNQNLTITEVAEDSITLSNGRTYTPGQFLRFVKDNEVEKAAKVKGIEDTKEKIEDVLQEDKTDDKKSDTTDVSTSAEEDISKNLLEDIWSNTSFLSINDLIKMWETITDYLKRNVERNSKRRAANTGKSLPGRLGLEFKNLAQTSENEMVNTYKDQLEQQGIDDMRSAMINAKGNTDLIKACIILLCSKGSFDFEDPKMWKALNEALYTATNGGDDYEALKINLDGGVNAQNEYPVDAMIRIMDKIWGKPGGKDWFNENKSAYDSEMGKAMTEAVDLENDPNNNGGVQAALHNMLVKHANGEYVPPYRFEGFLRQIIEAGKAEPEDKMFYIMAGYLVMNPKSDDGNDLYLLPKRRISAIEGKLLNNLPHLDYFTRFKPDGKNVLERKGLSEIFKKFLFNQKEVVNKDDNGKRFNQNAVKDFLWKDVMTFENVLRRASKAARNSENMDHDDAHVLIPMMEDNNVKQNVISNATGQKGKFSIEGYANGITGYTEYLKNLAELTLLPPEEQESRKALGFRDPKKVMQSAFKSWMIYESSLTGRVSYGPYTTLSSELLDGYALTDSKKKVIDHANEVREVLRRVLRAYGVSEKQIHVFLDLRTGKKNKDANEIHRQEIEKFSAYFDNLIRKDNGAKMLEVVQGEYQAKRLLGFEGVSSLGDPKAIEQAKERSESASRQIFDDDADSVEDPEKIIKAANRKAKKATDTAPKRTTRASSDEEEA